MKLLGIPAFELGELIHLRATIASADFAFDPHSVTEAVFADDLRCDENIVVRLCEIAASLAQEAKTLAADFDDALGIDDRSWRLRRLGWPLDHGCRLWCGLRCLNGFFNRLGSGWLRRCCDRWRLNRRSLAGGGGFIGK